MVTVRSVVRFFVQASLWIIIILAYIWQYKYTLCLSPKYTVYFAYFISSIAHRQYENVIGNLLQTTVLAVAFRKPSTRKCLVLEVSALAPTFVN